MRTKSELSKKSVVCMFLHFLFRDQYAAHIPRIFTWITQTRFYLLFLFSFPVIIGMVLLPCCQLGMCIRRANLWPACCMTCPAYLRWSSSCMAESWRKIFWESRFEPQLCNTVAHHTRAAIKPRKMSSINSTHPFFCLKLQFWRIGFPSPFTVREGALQDMDSLLQMFW